MAYFSVMMIIVAFVFISRLSNENKEMKNSLKSLEMKMGELEKSTSQ